MNRITGSLERLLETKAKGTIHRHPLSFREKAIVIAIARNRSCNQIANEMGIAHKTVSEYRQRASLKMGVWGVAGITHWAIENGLVELGDYE